MIYTSFISFIKNFYDYLGKRSITYIFNDDLFLTNKSVETVESQGYSEQGHKINTNIMKVSFGTFFKSIFTYTIKCGYKLCFYIVKCEWFRREFLSIDALCHKIRILKTFYLPTIEKLEVLLKENSYVLGIMNSFFYSFPVSISGFFIIIRVLRRGYKQAMYGITGALMGNLVIFLLIYFGFSNILIPIFSLDLFHFIFQLCILSLMIKFLQNEKLPSGDKNNLTSKEYFIQNMVVLVQCFTLCLLEEACFLRTLKGLNLSRGLNTFDLSNILNITETIKYLTSFSVGYLGFGLFCLFNITSIIRLFVRIMNFLIYILNILISLLIEKEIVQKIILQITREKYFNKKSFKIPFILLDSFVRLVNQMLIILLTVCSIFTFSYFGYDYWFVKPLGFLPREKSLEFTIFNPKILRIKGHTGSIGMRNDVTKYNRVATDVSYFNHNKYLFKTNEAGLASYATIQSRHDFHKTKAIYKFCLGKLKLMVRFYNRLYIKKNKKQEFFFCYNSNPHYSKEEFFNIQISQDDENQEQVSFEQEDYTNTLPDLNAEKFWNLLSSASSNYIVNVYDNLKEVPLLLNLSLEDYGFHGDHAWTTHLERARKSIHAIVAQKKKRKRRGLKYVNNYTKKVVESNLKEILERNAFSAKETLLLNKLRSKESLLKKKMIVKLMIKKFFRNRKISFQSYFIKCIANNKQLNLISFLFLNKKILSKKITILILRELNKDQFFKFFINLNLLYLNRKYKSSLLSFCKGEATYELSQLGFFRKKYGFSDVLLNDEFSVDATINNLKSVLKTRFLCNKWNHFYYRFKYKKLISRDKYYLSEKESFILHTKRLALMWYYNFLCNQNTPIRSLRYFGSMNYHMFRNQAKGTVGILRTTVPVCYSEKDNIDLQPIVSFDRILYDTLPSKNDSNQVIRETPYYHHALEIPDYHERDIDLEQSEFYSLKSKLPEISLDSYKEHFISDYIPQYIEEDEARIEIASRYVKVEKDLPQKRELKSLANEIRKHTVY